MASLLTSVLKTLTPAPVIVPEEYDGTEYRWKMFVFRPDLFKLEAYLLVGVIIYFLVAYIGVKSNATKAKKWFSAHLHILEQQFSKPMGKDSLTQDGYSDFYNFSTGRRNLISLHTVLTLKPRHDLFQRAWQIGKGLVDLHYRVKDDVTLDFRLAPGALPSDFIWAIVAKEELHTIKDERWDLTLTKTSENAALPPSLSVMSEFADVTESLLKLNLIATLKDPKVLPYFRSLSITDQPRQRPIAPIAPENRRKHVLLSLSLPDRATDTVSLVAAVLPFIDSLSQINLRPETKNKLKKNREELDKSLKAESEREKKEQLEQEAEDRRAEKRKAEQERISKLPAAEQQKILEKERKRALRKTQGKQMVRK